MRVYGTSMVIVCIKPGGGREIEGSQLEIRPRKKKGKKGKEERPYQSESEQPFPCLHEGWGGASAW